MDDIIEDLLEWQELETESESLEEFLQAESKKPEEFQIQNLESKKRREIMKRMTKKEFLRLHGRNCPVCRSENNEYIDDSSCFLMEGRVCTDCKAVWEEHHELSHYKLITDKTHYFYNSLQDWQKEDV